jgi:hypothetical protein
LEPRWLPWFLTNQNRSLAWNGERAYLVGFHPCLLLLISMRRTAVVLKLEKDTVAGF